MWSKVDLRLKAALTAMLLGTIWPHVAASAVSQALAPDGSKVNPKDNLMYVWIAPGTFQMGCSPNDSECNIDEQPRHLVTITNGFWMGATPVTQLAYRRVIDANPSKFKGDQSPVEMVSWDDAQAYCFAVEMRLPTEAEWEYAARGGSTAARYAPPARIAWYSTDSDGSTHQVAQKQANDFGVYDMLGNVWEWVADRYGPYQGSTDPKGPSYGSLRVMRGGSWNSDESVIRVSVRHSYGPQYRDPGVGFRCVGD